MFMTVFVEWSSNFGESDRLARHSSTGTVMAGSEPIRFSSSDTTICHGDTASGTIVRRKQRDAHARVSTYRVLCIVHDLWDEAHKLALDVWRRHLQALEQLGRQRLAVLHKVQPPKLCEQQPRRAVRQQPRVGVASLLVRSDAFRQLRHAHPASAITCVQHQQQRNRVSVT